MQARRAKYVADQGERGNSYHNSRAAVDPSEENVLRRVDLGHGDQSNRIAGQDRAVGPATIQKPGDIDAEPEPRREADREQLAILREPTQQSQTTR